MVASNTDIANHVGMYSSQPSSLTYVMRLARTRAYAKSIIVDVPKANASLDSASGVSDESSAREFGPITLNTDWPEETSIAIARDVAGM